MRLLIIDDCEEDRHTLRSMLEQAAPNFYTIYEASSPDEGVAAVQRSKPDCILLDYRMPEGSGFDVLDQLKDEKGMTSFPILMLTGQGDEQTAVRALKSGAIDYIPKKEVFANLHARLMMAYKQFQEEAARHAANERIRHELAIRDELLAVMAHELKTPLTVMTLNLSAARHSVERLKRPAIERRDVDAAEKRLQRAQDQIGRFERLVGNLTEATKFQNSALRLQRSPIDINEIVSRVASELRNYAEREGVDLSHTVLGQIVVYGDAERIEQVLNNLISNAIKYGARSPVHVTSVIDRGDATVRVTDGGPGIEAANQARIFKRYERATDARRADSLGLGLYISRQLARAHGGDLTVASVSGEGATFEFRIPLCSQAHICSDAGKPF